MYLLEDVACAVLSIIHTVFMLALLALGAFYLYVLLRAAYETIMLFQRGG